MWWKIDGSLAREIDFEVANLEVHKKTRGETLILKLQSKVWKLEEVSHEMLVLMVQRVSSRVSGFPVASPCIWGKLQNLSFSKVSKQVVMSFCVAGVAFRDSPTRLITCRKLFYVAGAILFASFSQDELQFSWQARHFGDLHRHFAWQAQDFRRVALRALHSTLRTLHSRLHTPHFTVHTLHFTLHTLHFTPHTLHSTLYTPLYAPHSTLLFSHFTFHALHLTLYTPDSTLHTPHLARHPLPYSTVYGALVW